jgi:hypothetical protein
MITLPLDSTEQDFINAAKCWLHKAAEEGYAAAITDFANHGVESCWTEDLFAHITNDHFDDGESCVITAPDGHQELRADVYKFDDGSGYAVEHDIALNGKASDFTLQIEFIKSHNSFRMFFRDIHVL